MEAETKIDGKKLNMLKRQIKQSVYNRSKVEKEEKKKT